MSVLLCLCLDIEDMTSPTNFGEATWASLFYSSFFIPYYTDQHLKDLFVKWPIRYWSKIWGSIFDANINKPRQFCEIIISRSFLFWNRSFFRIWSVICRPDMLWQLFLFRASIWYRYVIKISWSYARQFLRFLCFHPRCH